MTGVEVRALRDEEIGIELKQLREKLYMLRSQTVTEKVENTSQFRKIRKDVARLMTERNVRHHARLKELADAKAKAKAGSKA